MIQANRPFTGFLPKTEICSIEAKFPPSPPLPHPPIFRCGQTVHARVGAPKDGGPEGCGSEGEGGGGAKFRAFFSLLPTTIFFLCSIGGPFFGPTQTHTAETQPQQKHNTPTHQHTNTQHNTHTKSTGPNWPKSSFTKKWTPKIGPSRTGESSILHLHTCTPAHQHTHTPAHLHGRARLRPIPPPLPSPTLPSSVVGKQFIQGWWGEKGGPKAGAPMSLFPATTFFLFSLSLGVFSLILVVSLKRWGAQMCTFGVLGLSCEVPAAPKPPGFTRQPESPHRLTSASVTCTNWSQQQC